MNLCETCRRHCCSDLDEMALGSTEVALLRSRGTDLVDITDLYLQGYIEMVVMPGQRIFRMEGDCGFFLPADKKGWRKCALVNADGKPKEVRPKVCSAHTCSREGEG